MPRTKRAANALLQFYIDEDTATSKITSLERMLSGPSLLAFMKAQVEPYLIKRARLRFANEGDEVVGAWAPLTAATQRYRSDQGFGADHPINIRTGELFGFITRGANEFTSNPKSATIFMPGRGGGAYLRQKVRTAQQGKPSNPKTPARPVLALGANDLIHTLERLALYITEGVAHQQGMITAFEAWGT